MAFLYSAFALSSMVSELGGLVVFFQCLLAQVALVAQVGFHDSITSTLDASFNRPADIFVAAGGDVQAAINSAQAGDIIELQAGATFTGNFTLPNKSGNEWIYIRTSDYANLPAPGTRVGPGDTSHMARLRSTNKNTLLGNDSNAHNYRFIGIEFEAAYAATDVNYNIIRLGDNADNIVFDRVYIHGSATGNTYDGISAVGIGRLGIVDSYISEIHVAQGQQESHGIYLTQASGPVKIENNFISAAGENILVGGLIDSAQDPHVPVSELTTDLTIRGNHFFKPLSWQNPIASGPNAGLKWKVKNLLELKESNRVLIEGNIFENVWQDAQAGHAILFTPRDGPVMNMTFRDNVILLNNNSGNSGIHVGTAADALQDLLFEDNIIYGHSERFMTIGNAEGPIENLTIRHNTVVGTGTMMFFEGGKPAVDGMSVYDNILHNGFGILGSGTGYGLPTITNWTQNYDWNNNVVIGASNYTENSQFRGFRYAGGNDEVGFTDLTFNDIADFQLKASSPYKNAGTDGKDIGADVNAILAIMNQTAGSQSLQNELVATGTAAPPVGVDPLVLTSQPVGSDNGGSLKRKDINKSNSSGEEVVEDVVRSTVFSSIGESNDSAGVIHVLSVDKTKADKKLQDLSTEAAITDKLFSDDWESLSDSFRYAAFANHRWGVIPSGMNYASTAYLFNWWSR